MEQWRKTKPPGSLPATEHPYHCTGSPEVWENWASFEEEFGDSDLDMNLVFRWDWEPAGGYCGHESDTLVIYMMHQRKGRMVCHEVRNMQDGDEPRVRKYLGQHWSKLREMWAPISSPSPLQNGCNSEQEPESGNT